jgi:hypothetical protein
MAEVGVPVVDLPVHFFLRGIHIDHIQCDFNELFLAHGYVFIGFRSKPIALSGVLSRMAGKKILVVRDPRDMLVSLYYSAKFSHDLTERGTQQFRWLVRATKRDTEMGIDEYCLYNSWRMNEALFGYSEILDDPNTLILKYEDFIYNKVNLARSICNRFSLELGPNRIADIVAPHDIFPAADQPYQHVRQVHPGDHKRKLKPETINALNACCEKFLTTFNY